MKIGLLIFFIICSIFAQAENLRCVKYKKLDSFPAVSGDDIDRAKMELRAGTLKDVGNYFARIGNGCATEGYDLATKALAVKAPDRDSLIKFLKVKRYPELSVVYQRWLLIDWGIKKNLWKLADMKKAEFDILKGKIVVEMNLLAFNVKGLTDLSSEAKAEKFAAARAQALDKGQILWGELDGYIAALQSVELKK